MSFLKFILIQKKEIIGTDIKARMNPAQFELTNPKINLDYSLIQFKLVKSKKYF